MAFLAAAIPSASANNNREKIQQSVSVYQARFVFFDKEKPANSAGTGVSSGDKLQCLKAL